jgi:hypothetical protein
MRSTVHDASQSAAAGVDTRPSNSMSAFAFPTPPPLMPFGSGLHALDLFAVKASGAARVACRAAFHCWRADGRRRGQDSLKSHELRFFSWSDDHLTNEGFVESVGFGRLHKMTLDGKRAGVSDSRLQAALSSRTCRVDFPPGRRRAAVLGGPIPTAISFCSPSREQHAAIIIADRQRKSPYGHLTPPPARTFANAVIAATRGGRMAAFARSWRRE